MTVLAAFLAPYWVKNLFGGGEPICAFHYVTLAFAAVQREEAIAHNGLKSALSCAIIERV